MNLFDILADDHQLLVISKEKRVVITRDMRRLDLIVLEWWEEACGSWVRIETQEVEVIAGANFTAHKWLEMGKDHIF